MLRLFSNPEQCERGVAGRDAAAADLFGIVATLHPVCVLLLGSSQISTSKGLRITNWSVLSTKRWIVARV
jgi:hypothetical protein